MNKLEHVMRVVFNTKSPAAHLWLEQSDSFFKFDMHAACQIIITNTLQ